MPSWASHRPQFQVSLLIIRDHRLPSTQPLPWNARTIRFWRSKNTARSSMERTSTGNSTGFYHFFIYYTPLYQRTMRTKKVEWEGDGYCFLAPDTTASSAMREGHQCYGRRIMGMFASKTRGGVLRDKIEVQYRNFRCQAR